MASYINSTGSVKNSAIKPYLGFRYLSASIWSSPGIRIGTSSTALDPIGRPPPDIPPVLTFGTFAGTSYKEVAEKETQHYFWAESESHPSSQLSRYME